MKQTGQLAAVLQRLGECLHIPLEAADVNQVLRALEDSTEPGVSTELGMLSLAGRQLEMRLAATELTPRDAWTLVADGFPVLLQLENQGWLLLKSKVAWRLEATSMIPATSGGALEFTPLQLSLAHLKKYWQGQPLIGALLAQGTTAGISSRPGVTLGHGLSSVADHRGHVPGQSGHDVGQGHGNIRPGVHQPGHGGEGHAGHLRPLMRLWRMLRMELRDIWTLILFALIGGVLNLATPLAVESLVNTVAWGTYLQPLFVLTFLLFGFLAFAGLLKLLQVIIVEVLQRRLYVRIVGDLAHRFPMANRTVLESEHPAELANRYFDIMTIQKASASLILDGISIVLQTTTGLVLLAFYHPFLLGFDIILLVMMTVFTYLLGRGGIRSAINESRIKYEMGQWLQDVISSPTAFRLHGGSGYAVERANRLTVRYLMGRQDHFRVLVRQSAFALILLAVASTALLGVGGWLVIRGELTLGQLVASELVVTAIVGAFAKIGKSLESFYDLCAAVDKVGHMLDLPYDTPALDMNADGIPIRVRWQNLPIQFAHQDPAAIMTIEPGSRVAITGPSGSGKSRLLEILSGLYEPTHGFAEIAGFDSKEASRVADGHLISLARQPEIFCGSLLENVRLGRGWLSVADIRQALERVGLWEEVLRLPAGIDSLLQTGGFPLTYSQTVRLTLARALASVPSVLLIDGILDLLDPDQRYELWDHLRQSQDLTTIIITTHDPRIAGGCNQTLVCLQTTAYAQDLESHSHG
ncbi:MAG: ABC transporter ATP-binding protein [Pirellulaceae bacterium]|nr:ABC transporter ATP-binding protein [Pirellulaceae bacterium]